MARDRRITKRSENYSEWYNDVIRAADLVDESPTRGAMILKPDGYAIWERIQNILDKEIKVTGHQNVYFPLLVPKSLLSREAAHVAGFALESAVVTHHRLKMIDGELQPDPESKLSEEYVIRPTSEAIMYEAFSKWIHSYRDLPLLLNQWANVMRWEMRTRPFLRTSEFLWQEGHTAHATFEEAQAEQKKMLEVYQNFVRDYLAFEVIAGEKSESERFAGADSTMTLEGLMQDGKALQSATSHNLGQNFSRAFNISFTDQDGEEKLVWQTSWGISTRIIGALVMSHSDDNGLVLPPKIAPTQVVILPLIKDENESEQILEVVKTLRASLEDLGLRVVVDEGQHLSFGERNFKYEKKGVPLRIEIGQRDLQNDSVTVAVRDLLTKEQVPLSEVADYITSELKDMQIRLLESSQKFLKENITEVSSKEDFEKTLESKGGFILAPWDGTKETEKLIREQTGATIRCLPFIESGLYKGQVERKCLFSNQPTTVMALFAKAY